MKLIWAKSQFLQTFIILNNLDDYLFVIRKNVCYFPYLWYSQKYETHVYEIQCFAYAMETLRAKQKMLGGFMAQRLDKDV